MTNSMSADHARERSMKGRRRDHRLAKDTGSGGHGASDGFVLEQRERAVGVILM